MPDLIVILPFYIATFSFHFQQSNDLIFEVIKSFQQSVVG
jgi:ABC-type tungstate transport system substrate-binding protein